jgi:hypothetical protein
MKTLIIIVWFNNSNRLNLNMSETSQANEGCQRGDYYVDKEQETHYSEEMQFHISCPLSRYASSINCLQYVWIRLDKLC